MDANGQHLIPATVERVVYLVSVSAAILHAAPNGIHYFAFLPYFYYVAQLTISNNSMQVINGNVTVEEVLKATNDPVHISTYG